MRRRRILLLLTGCVSAALLLILLWPEPEPSYKGKPLSHWLAICVRTDNGPELLESAAAVRAIGTNAIPLLLKWLRYEPSALNGKLNAAVEKAAGAIGDSPVVDSLLNRGYHYSQCAVAGLSILGSNASPTIPQLVRMMYDTTNCPYSSRQALQALQTIGADAVPPLLQ